MDKGPQYFVMLTFLSLFPEGILLPEFVHFMGLKDIEYPSDWLDSLVSLSILITGADILPEKIKEKRKELDKELATGRANKLEPWELMKIVIDSKFDQIYNIISIREINLGRKTEVVIMTNYLVREAFNELIKEGDNLGISVNMGKGDSCLKLIHAALTNAIDFHRHFLCEIIKEVYPQAFDSNVEEDIVFSNLLSGIEEPVVGELVLDTQTPNNYKNPGILHEIFDHYRSSYMVLFSEASTYNYIKVSNWIKFYFGKAMEELENDAKSETLRRAALDSSDQTEVDTVLLSLTLLNHIRKFFVFKSRR